VPSRVVAPHVPASLSVASRVALWMGLALLGPTAIDAQRALPAERMRPCILMIVLDDVGTDKLALYAETPPTCAPGTCLPDPDCIPVPTGCVGPYPATPNLDELREGGILFTRAYATPVCSSTRAWIQTGRYGFRTGIGRATNTVTIPGDIELDNSEVFLPELLRGGLSGLRGKPVGLPYKCGSFGKWHMTTTLPQDYGHAVENGYDHFAGTMGNVGNFFRYTKVVHSAGSAPQEIHINGTMGPDAYTTETWHASVTSRDALAWIRAQPGSFLVDVSFGPPHTPIQVPPFELIPVETQCKLTCAGLAPGDILAPATDPHELLRLVHDAMIEAVDAEIGKLIHGIPPRTLANTMIFVIGDNGTAGFVVDDPPHDANRAKGQVYELGTRVPMFVSGPLVPTPPIGGWTSDALVEAVDMWETVAEISGADVGKVTPAGPLDSISFLPVLLDPSNPGNRTSVFTQYFSPNGIVTVAPPSCYEENQRSLSDGTYKYVRTQTSLSDTPCGTPTYTEELFDLSLDPGETNDLLLGMPSPEASAALAALSAEMDALSGL